MRRNQLDQLEISQVLSVSTPHGIFHQRSKYVYLCPCVVVVGYEQSYRYALRAKQAYALLEW